MVERRCRIAVGIALAAVLGSNVAQSHHGFDGRYDISQPIWIEGEITQAYFGQPHAKFTIRTPADLAAPARVPDLAGAASVIEAGSIQVRPDTRGRVVEVELPPTRAFFDLERSVRVGDRVAVIAIRNCEAPSQMYTQWVRPPRGAPVAQTLRLSFMISGC